jgi:hypothetical protein
METYRHSGAISPLGILLASSVGIATALVLGVIYSFGAVHIPFIKIHFLLTICFGGALGFAVGCGAKIGKIRNTFVATAYGFVIGLIGLYVAWAADLIARFVVPAGGKDYLKAFSPVVLVEYIKVFYENGAWAMKNGPPVSGIMLAAFWSIEAVIIVGLSTVVAWYVIADHPFCENCKRWTVNEKGNRSLSLIGANDALRQLLAGDPASLMKFNLAQNEQEYLQLDLALCSTCTESNFLTVQRVTETIDKEGKVNSTRTPLLQNMLIDAEYLPLVRHAGREPPSPETVAERSVNENASENGMPEST